MCFQRYLEKTELEMGLKAKVVFRKCPKRTRKVSKHGKK